MKFYTNKFPIKYIIGKDGKTTNDIQEGTVFKVVGINGDYFELLPIKDMGCNPVMVGCAMLNTGFIESDFID